VEDCADISEGECIVLCQDTGGKSTASSEGVSKVIAMDDNLLWTASSSSKIQRWWVPQRRALRAQALHLDGFEAERTAIPDSYILPPIPISTHESPTMSPTLELPAFRLTLSSKTALGSSAPSLQDSTTTSTDQLQRFYGREDETALFGIPLRSLVRLTSPNDPYATYTFTRGNDPEVATLYSAASIMSVPRPVPSRSTSHKHVTAHANSAGLSPHQTNSARADYEEREIAADAAPLCGVPDYVIEGEHGLVRSVMLNDRIHALTVDTAGEVAVWDIVKAVCCGRYVPEEVASVSRDQSVGGGETKASPREALEAVRERIEGEAVVLAWSAVDTKTGVLTVHLNERCFEGEVFADEVDMTHDRHITDESRSESRVSARRHRLTFVSQSTLGNGCCVTCFLHS
jgi:WD repeat-containing protein 48